MYWVSTLAGEVMGPYDDYAKAYASATINFGFSGWKIIESTENGEEE